MSGMEKQQSTKTKRRSTETTESAGKMYPGNYIDPLDTIPKYIDRGNSHKPTLMQVQKAVLLGRTRVLTGVPSI